MARLAIKGHVTRGKEVIEILKMLGGKISDEQLYGTVTHYRYYIQGNGYIGLEHYSLLNNVVVFTLEEFLEKFPYKVGDKVVYENKKREITKMVWEERTNTVAYKLDDKLYCNVIDELQPYKEVIMEKEGVYAYNEINCYHQDFGDKVKIRLGGDYEIKVEDKITYIVKKQPQYPKTYEDCCKIMVFYSNILNWNNPFCINRDTHPYIKHLDNLMESFYKLLICRDAYWKMAGEQMGLGKPWEPDNNNPDIDLYVIINIYNRAEKATYGFQQCVLAFPTKEMRDAFYENFKELINECKSLL